MHAYILNTKYPYDAEGLWIMVQALAGDKAYSNVDYVVKAAGGSVVWTVPKGASDGEVVYFNYAQSAIEGIRAIKKAYAQSPSDFPIGADKMIQNEEAYYKKFGGQIFAVGRMKGNTFIDPQDPNGWAGTVSDIQILANPLKLAKESLPCKSTFLAR